MPMVYQRQKRNSFGMTETPLTRDSLLLRLRDPANNNAWAEFADLYRPMVYRIARRQGLQSSDADDLAQQVLIAVTRAIPGWERDPARGTFRSWLATVTRNQIINLVTRGPKELAVGGSGFQTRVAHLANRSDELETLIQQEYQRSVLRLAADHVRQSISDQTWNAFWMTAVENQSVTEVADQLSMTAGAIYGARARVMKQLRDAADSLSDFNATETLQ